MVVKICVINRMNSEICGVPTKADIDLINKISKLDPRLAVFSTTRGGARPGRNASDDVSAETLDYLLAGIVFAGLLGVSYAAIQVMMMPKVASLLAITLPCEGGSQQGLMQILSIVAQGVGKTCAQRQAEFDAYITNVKMLVLGGGTVGLLSGTFSIPSIAKAIHTARAYCNVKKSVNLNSENARAREQLARGGSKSRKLRKTRKNRKH